MSAHLSYEDQIKLVIRGLITLAVITILEVGFALLAKGHVSPNITFGKDPGFGHVLYMLAMIGASLYKAYFIIFYFMHMASEVRSFAMTVLLPTLLLVWAIIAFFQEGGAWGARREQIEKKNMEKVESAPKGNPQGYFLAPEFGTGRYLG